MGRSACHRRARSKEAHAHVARWIGSQPLFGVAGRALLDRLAIPEPWRGTVEASLSLIDDLDAEIDLVDRQRRLSGADHPYIPLLLTVPGIGWVLASTIGAEIGHRAMPPSRVGVAVGAGSVWVAHGSSEVVRLDPDTGDVRRRDPIPYALRVNFAEGAGWVEMLDARIAVARIGPATNAVTRPVPWFRAYGCCHSAPSPR